MSTSTAPAQAEGAGMPAALGRTELDHTMLRPPSATHDVVGHERLLSLRPEPSEAPVVAMVAPAGYGKSTVLSEWVAHDDGRVLWVTLDGHADDPAALVGAVVAALLESGVRAPQLVEAMRAPAASVWTTLMPRLSAALHDAAPLTLVLDDVHKVVSRESWDIIDWIVLHVPAGAQVILSGRSLGGVAMPRLEVGGHLAQRGPRDLALTDTEAYALLQGTGPTVSLDEATRLNRSCDGWVSGLLMGGTVSPADSSDSAARSRQELVDEYVEAEILQQLSPEDREFLLWTSILRVTSPSLCDAVLERSDSHDALERLCSANAFVSRVGDGWCRMHDLIRYALLRQVERRDPERVAALRSRAATWYAEQGHPAEAVQYSMASGHADRTIELIGHFVVPLYSSGRSTTLEHWLDWAESKGLTAGSTPVVVATSIVSALAGDPERSQRWAALSREAHSGRTGHGRDPLDTGHLALAAAWQGDRGAEVMLEDARRATESLPEASPWRKSALSALAVAQLMNGLDAESGATFQQVVDEGGPARADSNARSGAMVFLAMQAIREQQLGRAEELLECALAVREEHGITEQGLQALLDAVQARVVLMRGAGVEDARRLLAHAQRVRSLVTWAMPGLALPLRLELVKAHLALGDVAGARVVSREASDILHQRPGQGVFEAKAKELRERVTRQSETVQGPSSLTAAELRLVPWLATHLSFREIGERLFLSTNTVKTEALSTYRKLGASSRSEAVEAAVNVGLLDPASLPGILAAGAWRAQEVT